jgi:hypothetical protein
MENFKNRSNHFLLVLSLLTVIFISACSDDNEEVVVVANSAGTDTSKSVENYKMAPAKLSDKQYYQEMSQPLDKATWSEKGKFKKEFSEDCVVREIRNSVNKENDRKRFEKTCDCIANYMSDHLTDDEAEEYLRDDNHTRSLQIRFDAAAYHCLQEAKQPDGPVIFKNN